MHATVLPLPSDLLPLQSDPSIRAALAPYGGGGFVARGIDDDGASSTFAVAFGAQVGFVTQREMDDTALARRHGTKAVGFTGAADVFGGDAGGELQFVDANGAEVLAVEPDLLVLVALEMQNLGGEQLEGAKELAATVEEKGGVSGCSHSRFCGMGGSTVMRYLSLKPPFEMTAWRNSPICLAADTLSVIGISQFSVLSCQFSVKSGAFTGRISVMAEA
jgi:hypothetical protein